MTRRRRSSGPTCGCTHMSCICFNSSFWLAALPSLVSPVATSCSSSPKSLSFFC